MQIALPTGIQDADWLQNPASARALINAQQQEDELLRGHLTLLPNELENLRERIGRSSRNSSSCNDSQGITGFVWHLIVAARLEQFCADLAFAQQLAAGGEQGLVGLLVCGDLDEGGGVGEPHGSERHAGHRLVDITDPGGEAVDDLQSRGGEVSCHQ